LLSLTESAATAPLPAPRSAPSTCFKSMAENCGVSRLKRASGPSPNSCAGLIQAWRSIHTTRPRRARVPGSLPARLRGHRIEAARLTLPLRPHRTLDQGQEPEGASGKARSPRGLAIAAGDIRCRLLSAEHAAAMPISDNTRIIYGCALGCAQLQFSRCFSPDRFGWPQRSLEL
jgi:hypothetical protein